MSHNTLSTAHDSVKEHVPTKAPSSSQRWPVLIAARIIRVGGTVVNNAFHLSALVVLLIEREREHNR